MPRRLRAPRPALAALAVLALLARPAAGAQASERPNVAARVSLGPVAVTVERGCPPPGLLACRPGVRVVALAPTELPEAVGEAASVAVAHGLRVFGYRDLVTRELPGAFAGRITARGETLARWRQDGPFAEIAAGGLELLAPAGRRAELAAGPGLWLEGLVLRALARDIAD